MKIKITEKQLNSIQENYNLSSKNDYVFDMVLSENNKYLIIMDQVFINGGNGNTIGSIWENTYIFNEILNESLISQNIITETNKDEIENILNNITWSKDVIKKCLNNNTIITEGWWNDLSKKIGSSSMNLISNVWNQGILPFLRWVRRGLYTGTGIVIDVIVSILAAKSNMVVWGIIVLLDIYEIITNDFDPQDDTRRQMPYLLIICDLMGVVFSGGVASLFKKSGQTIAKEGIQKASPTMVKYLKILAEKIPSLSNGLKSTANLLSKKMGQKSSGFISVVLRSLDSILTKVVSFINKLFSKEGLKAGTVGGTVYGSTELIGKGLERTNVGSNITKYGKNVDNFFQKNIKSTQLTDNEVNDVFKQLQLSVNNM